MRVFLPDFLTKAQLTSSQIKQQKQINKIKYNADSKLGQDFGFKQLKSSRRFHGWSQSPSLLAKNKSLLLQNSIQCKTIDCVGLQFGNKQMIKNQTMQNRRRIHSRANSYCFRKRDSKQLYLNNTALILDQNQQQMTKDDDSMQINNKRKQGLILTISRKSVTPIYRKTKTGTRQLDPIKTAYRNRKTSSVVNSSVVNSSVVNSSVVNSSVVNSNVVSNGVVSSSKPVAVLRQYRPWSPDKILLQDINA